MDNLRQEVEGIKQRVIALIQQVDEMRRVFDKAIADIRKEMKEMSKDPQG